MINQRILITGGLGFIGRNLTDLLLGSGNSVHAVDINIHMQNWQLSDHYSRNSKFSFSIENCENPNAMLRLLSDYQPTLIYHFAANSDISKAGNLAHDFHNTLITTLSLCEALRIYSLKPHIVFASSSAIYGNTTNPMQVGSRTINLPVNAYGWAKSASELALIGLARTHGQSLTIARFPNVVGQYLTHGLLFDLIRKYLAGKTQIQILGDGTQKKPFIHVLDLLKTIISVSSSQDDAIKTINISPIDQISVREVVNIFSEQLGNDLTFLYENKREGWIGDVPEYQFDLNEARIEQTLVEVKSQDAITKAIKENLRDSL